MDAVGHGDGSFGERGEDVLVMPEAVGAEALFVHEVIRLADGGDFGEPGELDAEERADTVFDHQALVHFFREAADDLEIELRRRDAGEVARVGEKGPAVVRGGVDGLCLLEKMDHRRQLRAARGI